MLMFIVGGAGEELLRFCWMGVLPGIDIPGMELPDMGGIGDWAYEEAAPLRVAKSGAVKQAARNVRSLRLRSMKSIFRLNLRPG